MRKAKRIYASFIVLSILALASCSPDPEIRGAGLECEGGTPETGLTYDEESHMVVPLEIWGRGWNKMPDIPVGNGRAGIQVELRRSYTHKLEGGFDVDTWS